MHGWTLFPEVTSPSQGSIDKQPCTYIHEGYLEWPIKLECMFLDCGKKLELFFTRLLFFTLFFQFVV